jgi:phenylacetic acid degradation operon negative regulatory protein
VVPTTDRFSTIPDEVDLDIPTRVLVLGMTHQDGTILASELYPVAEACHQTADQVRSCLRRLVSEDLFVREGEGREAVFTATPAGMDAIGSTLRRTRLAFHQDATGRGWDGHWHLVAFAMPETKRAARDAFRDRLLELGGASVQNGLYVSPHPWEPEVRAEAEQLGVVDLVTLASTEHLEIGGVTEPRAVAERLWSVESLGGRYREFCELYQDIPETLESLRRNKRRLTEAEFLPGSLVIGIKFLDVFNDDPLLPPELLPRPWPGRKARDLLARSRRLSIMAREDHDKSQLFAPFDELLG